MRAPRASTASRAAGPNGFEQGRAGPSGRPACARRLQQHAELSAEATIEQIARGVLFDPRDFFDAQGHPKPLHELTEAQAQCIASVEVVLKNAAAGDGVVDRVLRLKFVDRLKALELAAKYHGLLLTRIEATIEAEEIGRRLDAGRLRAAGLAPK